MAKGKEKKPGLMAKAANSTRDFMQEMGTELGLTEQPKVSAKQKKVK
ncbi:hypothetical protein Desca_2052 [Desulfotomaculum nigrificans CO-1-SRB]|uniref:Uncharacterized protein n=1 Tax=Desulfotomaculum nigrificans (strain DSM 14880 / VKM B-2319 / CO-1-SRB) TaxID=868595 RepID=F6B9J5_DESCC|nr:hypothetical protein [Desulfotomaculum nigrificans]AEF94891.1 hypothetical protein Desca_2052 [Desulfotomaculum nigrificans CO-1-SRB]